MTLCLTAFGVVFGFVLGFLRARSMFHRRMDEVLEEFDRCTKDLEERCFGETALDELDFSTSPSEADVEDATRS